MKPLAASRKRNSIVLWAAAAAALWTGGVYVLSPKLDTVPFMASPSTGAHLAPAALATRLLLVGDAGLLPQGSAVMRALAARSSLAPERTVVLFLGDNIYPAGLPHAGAPDRAGAEELLNRQLEPLKDIGARVIFLPGNHDWSNSGRDGRLRVLEQEGFVRAAGDNFDYLPRHAEPGPACVDFDGVRLLALDSQWWLHQYDKPQRDQAHILEDIRRCVDESAQPVVLATHHPPVSYGPHGGVFTRRDHLLPLLSLHGRAYLPLPILGSLYVWLRSQGISRQDTMHSDYQAMVSAITGAVSTKPPLLWAAGHEHNLLVEKGHAAAQYVLVSGSGSRSGITSHGNDSLFSASRSGFAEVVIAADGAVTLGVWDAAGPARTPLWTAELTP